MRQLHALAERHALTHVDRVPSRSQACYQICGRWRLHHVTYKRRSTVAFIAALVLVLQSFLSAWTASAFPATPMLDAFGSPLCITSGDHHGTAPANDHSKMPNCCALGCSMASPLLAAAPGNGVGLLRPLSSNDIQLHHTETFLIEGQDHDPGSPRAPPLTT